jgi:serine/threonine-protein kinase
MPLADGQTFAGYTILRLLGSGGMGEVYLAQHPRLPRKDALKVLGADVSADAEYRARFSREADLASTLWHPHIVGVHDRGEDDGQLWIAMDYVDGLDAARLLADQFSNGMPPRLVANIVTALASALDHAHQQGLLHRDVKPANIMLTNGGGEQRILLADFGVARSLDDISGLTATNFTVGTVAYAAPEQLTGADIDGHADQYALAATAYHLLTGSHLFPHSNPAVVIGRHLTATPPVLADTRPELADLDPVLATALAKNPDGRFPRCADFVRALAQRAAENGSSSLAANTTPAPATRKPVASTLTAPPRKAPSDAAEVSSSRKRRLIGAAALPVIVLVGVVALVWRPWQQHESASTATPKPTAPQTLSTTSSAMPPPPPTPTPVVFPASAIDTTLLSAGELNGLLKTFATSAIDGQVGILKMGHSSYGMSDHSAEVTPPACVGVVYGAEHAVYANTGFQKMRDETFSPQEYVYDPTTAASSMVEQTVAVFPSAQQAQAFLTSSEKQWQSWNTSSLTTAAACSATTATRFPVLMSPAGSSAVHNTGSRTACMQNGSDTRRAWMSASSRGTRYCSARTTCRALTSGRWRSASS